MNSNTTRHNDDLNSNRDSNPDPITGAPGSHPVGTGIGAAGGGAAGAAIGAAVSGPAAPVGAVVGAVIGAVAGGLAGKGAGEAVNPSAEDAYWRNSHKNRPYFQSDYNYDNDYRPAYEYGWSSASQHSGRQFQDVENDLGTGWENHRGESRLDWDKAKHATRDAWDRLVSRGDDNTATTNSAGTSRSTESAYPGHTTGATAGGGDDLDVNTFAQSSRTQYAGRNFDEIESDLHRDWDTRSGNSGRNTWDKVKDSVRRAWDKV